MPDEVVIITGANSGIGLGLARALHARGARVAGLDLSTENLPDIRSFVCDVTDPRRVHDVTDHIIEEWGGIDILVNNACLAIFSDFESRSDEETRRELEVNFFGYVNMIRAVLPTMKAAGGGVIHNVSSTVGLSGFAGLSGYASSKGAIEALTRTLAIELEPHGITVNLIHPPLTRTPSSAPLGIPDTFMEDAENVGRKLARRIASTRPVITPGPAEAIGVIVARLFPHALGRFMSRRAAEARSASAR